MISIDYYLNQTLFGVIWPVFGCLDVLPCLPKRHSSPSKSLREGFTMVTVVATPIRRLMDLGSFWGRHPDFMSGKQRVQILLGT